MCKLAQQKWNVVVLCVVLCKTTTYYYLKVARQAAEEIFNYSSKGHKHKRLGATAIDQNIQTLYFKGLSVQIRWNW